MARAPAAKPAPASEASTGGSVGRDDVGFLLAKATQRWNELLASRFAAAGYADLRPSYGSILLPLYEEDGLRIGELARRARLSKQTLTDLVRRLERDGLIERRPDPSDARASLIYLTPRSRRFEPVAAATLADLNGLVRTRLSSRRLGELKTRAPSADGPRVTAAVDSQTVGSSFASQVAIAAFTSEGCSCATECPDRATTSVRLRQ